jgi:hypothetical protein
MEKSVADLEQQKVPLTYKNLTAMGYGMAAVRNYFKKRKRDVQDE